MEIYNKTSFPVHPAIIMDCNGAEKLIVIVKMTWRIDPSGDLSPADEQMPILASPVYRGEPDSSSLIYESDVAPQKTGTDCILIGHAYAPRKDTSELEALFSIGPLVKVVRVYGERKWGKFIGVHKRIGPIPFEKMPLIYERSFGGTDVSYTDIAKHEACLDNPVGRGFIAKHSNKEIEGMLFPNIEDAEDPYKGTSCRPKPAGFGAIAPSWKPRVDYAGTYNDNWRKRIFPLPPADLKPEFYNYAAPGLTSKGHFQGNEKVALGNVTSQSIFRFSLPGIRPQMLLRMMGLSQIEIEPFLDTVIVEPDDMRVQMVWRGGYDTHGKIQQIKQIIIAT